MNNSENINELAMALAKAQAEMTPAIKDSNNPFFKSKYADLTSVWSACRDPLTKNGLSVVQTMNDIDGKLFLVSWLLHSSGQYIKSNLPIISQKNDAQSLGAAITYMRRFSLCALVGICPEDDDGNIASGKNINTQSSSVKITKEQFLALSKKLDLVPNVKNQIKTWLSKQGINDLMDIHLSMYDGLLKAADEAVSLQEKSA